MAEVQVENIIVSFSVSSSLDLPKLAAILPDAQYNPDDVPALVMLFTNPRSMATLSSSGTVVVTGPKSMDEASDVVKMIVDRLKVVGVKMQETPEITVQNVTGSSDLHQKLKLRSLAKSLQIEDYNPKIFPGLVYKGDDPNTVILLFDSGKIVCNGMRLEDVTVAIDKMLEKLLSFGIKTEENVCQK
ncbi:MAG TPA: TATA-box-binding protein [Thermoplasmata archaeon]|jgi:transcription initiation factor TFIID TATA-box-binding protein|nr:MAG TPA: TATA-box-binding protein [Thermoplasmata archaeon]